MFDKSEKQKLMQWNFFFFPFETVNNAQKKLLKSFGGKRFDTLSSMRMVISKKKVCLGRPQKIIFSARLES